MSRTAGRTQRNWAVSNTNDGFRSKLCVIGPMQITQAAQVANKNKTGGTGGGVTEGEAAASEKTGGSSKSTDARRAVMGHATGGETGGGKGE